MEEMIGHTLLFRLGKGSFTGMTYKSAGNFATRSLMSEATKHAHHILEKLKLSSPSENNKLAIMMAQEHTDLIFHVNEQIPNSVICQISDGAILKGKGSIFFYPGGCAAIAFKDEKARITGLLHGSRQTIAKGIIEKFLTQWQKSGGKNESTQIKFLPSICSRCLQYDAKIFNKSIKPDLENFLISKKLRLNEFYTQSGNKIHFQLNFLIDYLIKKEGFCNLHTNTECTCCSRIGPEHKYNCYRHHDHDNTKYRNAAFILTVNDLR